MTKTCTKCHLDKDITEFAFKGGGKRHSWCRTCHKEYYSGYYATNGDSERARVRARAAEQRDELDRLKAKPCADCNVQYPPWVMQFDHINDDKEHTISRLRRAKRFSEAFREAEKCEVVCANCHADRTYQRSIRGSSSTAEHGPLEPSVEGSNPSSPSTLPPQPLLR